MIGVNGPLCCLALCCVPLTLLFDILFRNWQRIISLRLSSFAMSIPEKLFAPKAPRRPRVGDHQLRQVILRHEIMNHAGGWQTLKGRLTPATLPENFIFFSV
ncbi:hypothetical protein L0337_10580 [candidate division KSB1 bacterium]|nr:hypothetical protein [candidate division KSB1 bacterium]